MSVAEFLNGLPSINENNFANFHTDNGNRTCVKRPSVYLPTKEYPSEQIIVTEKTAVMLRYLHQKWDQRSIDRKRELEAAVNGEEPEEIRSKRPRLDHIGMAESGLKLISSSYSKNEKTNKKELLFHLF